MRINSIISYLFIIAFVFNTYLQAEEENKIELNSIKFVGNEYFSSTELKDIIYSKETPSWFSKFLNSFTSFGNPASYFDSLQILDDVSILKNLYMSYGFFKVKINAEYSISGNEKKYADLVFYIQENDPSFIHNYKFTGLENIPEKLQENIKGIITLDTAIQYSDYIVEENNDLILNFLQDKGYMLVKNSLPVVKIDTFRNTVDVNINFELGKRYKISEVSVEKSGPGEKLVSEDLIREIVNIKPDNYYSYHALKLSQIRLYRTNLFSSAVITPSYQDTSDNYVPIKIKTVIGKLNELSPEIIGINENNIFKLGFGLNFINKNFLGDARKLTIGLSFAAQNIAEFIKEANLASSNIFGYADARISLEQPFLFGKIINTKFETYYTLEKKKNEWNANIYGAKLNFNFELSPYTYVTALSTYFTWEKSKYIFQEEYLLDRLPDSLVDGSLTTNSTSAILGVQLVANKTDDLLFPTKGYSLALIAEDGNSIPYAASKLGGYNFNQPAYYKLVLTSSFYFPFFEDYIDAFGTKIKIGNIQTYFGNPLNIPYNQRFTAGGSNSIRGWKANDLPEYRLTLRDNFTQAEIENIARKITPGGFFLLEGSIEARQHLSNKIGFAMFVDYGNVWDNYYEFRYDELAVAAGFGFRYYSDFAPIRLDIGFKVYDPQDRRSFFTRIQHSPFLRTMEFQIGIGEAF